MPLTCFVPGCGNRRKKCAAGKSFHKFPNGIGVAHKWLAAIGRDPNTLILNQRICSDHFREDQFDKTATLIRLRSDVMPNLNLPLPAENMQPSILSVHESTIEMQSSPSLMAVSSPESSPFDRDDESKIDPESERYFKMQWVDEQIILSNKVIEERAYNPISTSPTPDISLEITNMETAYGQSPYDYSPGSVSLDTQRSIINTFHNYR